MIYKFILCYNLLKETNDYVAYHKLPNCHHILLPAEELHRGHRGFREVILHLCSVGERKLFFINNPSGPPGHLPLHQGEAYLPAASGGGAAEPRKKRPALKGGSQQDFRRW